MNLGNVFSKVFTDPLSALSALGKGIGDTIDGSIDGASGQKSAQPGTNVNFGEEQSKNTTELSF